mgnify:CR=1 FL=1
MGRRLYHAMGRGQLTSIYSSLQSIDFGYKLIDPGYKHPELYDKHPYFGDKIAILGDNHVSRALTSFTAQIANNYSA